jgi:hypothetical protein
MLFFKFRERPLKGGHFGIATGWFWPGKRLIGPPILDIQHEDPRGVGKSRLLTLTCPS